MAAFSSAATAPLRTITDVVCPSGILPCTNPTQIVRATAARANEPSNATSRANAPCTPTTSVVRR